MFGHAGLPFHLDLHLLIVLAAYALARQCGFIDSSEHSLIAIVLRTRLV